jgi:hypothetical protein
MDKSDEGPSLINASETELDGSYRVAGIPPGRFYMVVGNSVTPVDFPGSRLENVDFILEPPKLLKVSGRVVRNQNPANIPLDTVSLKTEDWRRPLSARIVPDGRFEFPEVPPGIYRLAAAGAPDFSARVVVVGNDDMTSLEMRVPARKTITGRIIMEDGSAAPPIPLRLHADAPDRHGWASEGVEVRTTADGGFAFEILEGTYNVHVFGVPVGFHLKSASYGAVDLASKSMVVRADDTETLRLTLGRGPGPGAVIVKGQVVGEASSIMLVGPQGTFQALVAPDGTFGFPSVPPGAYQAMLNGKGVFAFSEIVVGPDGISDWTWKLGTDPK